MESETINKNIELAPEFETVVGGHELEKFLYQIILILIPISWKNAVPCVSLYGNGVSIYCLKAARMPGIRPILSKGICLAEHEYTQYTII